MKATVRLLPLPCCQKGAVFTLQEEPLLSYAGCVCARTCWLVHDGGGV